EFVNPRSGLGSFPSSGSALWRSIQAFNPFSSIGRSRILRPVAASFLNLSSFTLDTQIEIDAVHRLLKVEIREMCMGKTAAAKRTPLTSSPITTSCPYPGLGE